MRYVTLHKQPRSVDWEDMPPVTGMSVTVYELADEPVETGLLDVNGSRLYRVREPRIVGFCRKMEE